MTSESQVNQAFGLGDKAPRKVKVTEKHREELAANSKRRREERANGIHNLSSPLNAQQTAFATLYGRDGLNVEAAARMAGYSYKNAKHAGNRMLLDPRIRALMRQEQDGYKKANDVTKLDVIEGFKEAIEMARIKADPIVMVAGWREIARVCGYYEPVKVRMEVSHTGKVLLEAVANMTDAQLMESLTDENRSQALEGEFKSIAQATASEVSD